MARQTVGVGAIQADASVMARVAQQDATVWRVLADQQLGRVLLLAKRMLGNHHEAEDVTQEAFIRLWRQASHWTGEARISTWLYRVVHNLCIDRLRRHHGGLEDEESMEEPVESLFAPAWESPLVHLEQSEQRQILNEAMARLPLRHRTALVLVYVLGLHSAEAALVMRIGEDAMASLLVRSRRRLRLLLTPWRDELLGK
ncbi:MAG: sigma-70 family RNA polymerase sigma factor [Nitrospirae bacterium]|nr:sigma-70 family RNA polymerase sigma factor [Magnetococcales bacterium]HAT51309.1 hypothetical protein [Alphaproteobacteria bacterium]